MKNLLPLKNDFVFKQLFGTDTEILIDLINCVLKLPEEEKIVAVKIKNPMIMAEEVDRKYVILDVRAKDEAGREYDIEMQVRRYEHYPQRALYYLCKMYAGQLKSGDDYTKLLPVIGIHFLDYRWFPDHGDFHYHFCLRDARYPELRLADDLSLHIFELPAIENQMKKEEEEKMKKEAEENHRDIVKDGLMEWLHFFNHAHEEKEETMKQHYTNPMIHKAFQCLTELSADEIARDLAERREKALKDEAMFLAEAMDKGIKQGIKQGTEQGAKQGSADKARQVAELLLSMGDPVEKIAKVTGLAVDEVRKLDKQHRKSAESPS